MIGECARAGLAQSRAESRIGHRSSKLTVAMQVDVTANVVANRKSAPRMARFHNISGPAISCADAAAWQSTS